MIAVLQALGVPGFAAAQPPVERSQRVAGVLAWGAALLLLAFLALPLVAILGKAVTNQQGGFVGIDQFVEIAGGAHFWHAVANSMAVSVTSAIIVLPLAYVFATALTRTCMPLKPLFRGLALIPLLAPSLLPGIALVYLFGNQGVLKGWFPDGGIYGFWGIVIAEVFYTFPHALMILITALSVADARLYEAASALGAGPVRRLFTVTLPAARYGLISAALVVFTLVIVDFGAPKVIGGQYNVLAVEAYKQVIGQQNFPKGAVIGLLLLLPAVFSFIVDAVLQKRQRALLTARAQPLVPQPQRWVDGLSMLACSAISAGLLLIIGTAIAAAFIKLWPYNLAPTLAHFDFDNMDGGGWLAFRNSLKLAGITALAGTVLVFTGAYLAEKTQAAPLARQLIRLFAMLPMAVPGLVLGLGYIFFFNDPHNPLHVVYGTLAILVLCSVAHFYTTAHLTAVTALKQLDGEFEAVAASLKVPFWTTAWRVTLPVCLPAVLEVARYFFVSAMTTVSAVIFLYTPDTVLASVAVLNMDDAGDTAAAAGMAALIVGTSALVCLLFGLLSWLLQRRTQAWRRR
ncbi:iron(III) transport system permease protein [Andreprevotia lacus DSM 23236]|jgi:iron(III) transport system permease protein|uniref:Iron(III) transport system permease protein n=1 Tax=Andreprevotia lacus DSM 23236 TaxID=1121001 RepID=A0A1W1XPF6_9NEIS|nr:putative 2-aminoethylphosphonate ABC transporter permease subunit [Andreprevotia lacus]SMC25870.1 iron(III) transport system permease protein [Andreprevotia lacus DSM 23236]